MPWGGPGADVGEIIRNNPLQLAPVWGHFWNKMMMFLRCFLDRIVDDLFIEFWWFWEYFEEVFGELLWFVFEKVKY